MRNHMKIIPALLMAKFGCYRPSGLSINLLCKKYFHPLTEDTILFVVNFFSITSHRYKDKVDNYSYGSHFHRIVHSRCTIGRNTLHNASFMRPEVIGLFFLLYFAWQIFSNNLTFVFLKNTTVYMHLTSHF